MHPDAQASRVAAKQGGLTTRKQLLAMGFSDAKIERRVATGQWTRTARGVYRLFEGLTPGDELRAAVAVLPGAVASHFSAARIHQIDRVPPGPVTVLVHTRTTHIFPGVEAIRCHDLQAHHVESVDRLPTTTAARTVVDLASRLTVAELAICLDSVLNMRLASGEAIAAVLDEVARKGKPGVRSLRTVLGERIGLDQSRSVLEQRGLALLASFGFGSYEIEYPIPWAPRQRFDVAFPQSKLAVEWDSRRWHGHLGAFQNDRERDRAALLNGWRVVRFTWDDVRDRPESVVATLRQLTK